MIRITKNWANLLKDEFEKPYFKQLQSFLADEYSSHTVYPAMENIFNALNAVKYEDVKVVILDKTLIMSQIKHMVLLFQFKTA